MTTSELLADLRARGVVLTVAGDKLRVDAPRGVLTDSDRALLAEHKADLLAFLAAESVAPRAIPAAALPVAGQPAPLPIRPGDLVVVIRPPGRYVASGDELEADHPARRIVGPVAVRVIRRRADPEPWAVVATGRAYPSSWLRPVAATRHLDAPAPSCPQCGGPTHDAADHLPGIIVLLCNDAERCRWGAAMSVREYAEHVATSVAVPTNANTS